MPVSTPPTVSPGDPVLASGLDALLSAADERLSRLYSGSRSWYAFDTSTVPPQQIPPTGAVYVISEDAHRSILPAPGTPGGPNGPWPSKYDHADHIAQAAAMVITGPDTLGVAWVVTGSFASGTYSFGDSASVLERTHLGETRPLKLSSAYEPERFHRYALADVFIESTSGASFDWTHDKYGVVRFHNLSKFAVTVNLGSSTISIEARRVRTIRRETRTSAWDTTLRRFFPKALPGDIPMWDSDTSSMGNLPLRSQSANPIFRQAMLQAMFQPHALTVFPGMFSATILPVLPDLDSSNTLASAIVQAGEFDVIRTSTGASHQDQFTLLYSGESLASTPASWAAVGLRTVLDDSTRGAVLSADPGFPQPEDGTWKFDAISRTTNVLGGVVCAIDNGSVTSRVVLPWFADAEAADAWYASLFEWPTYGVVRTATSIIWNDSGVWTPLGFGSDPDYYGTWDTPGVGGEVREYVIEWGGETFGTVSAWNVFTKTIASSLPPGGQLVRQPLLTAVVAYPSVDFWQAREDATWDDAGSVIPRERGQRGIFVAGQSWGLGTIDGSEIQEPRWQAALFPTIGWAASSSWYSYPFYGPEEWIWTSLLPDGSGGTIRHWRVSSAEGAANGEPWAWVFSDSGSVTGSGMSFWRMFYQGAPVPQQSAAYPGKPKTGPQPWPTRDHGWLADLVLGSGSDWTEARSSLYDTAPISVAEQSVGVQVRMNASAFNQLSKLIAGMSHVRPCGWEQYVDGFSFDLLVSYSGWDVVPTSGFNAQPYGAVHVYGVDTTTDAKLDSLGVPRRAYADASLQAFQSTASREFFITVSFPFSEPLYVSDQPATFNLWSADIGDTLEYCTADDLHAALQAEGFAYNLVSLVQPVSIESVSPGTTPETEVDTFVGSGPVSRPITLSRIWDQTQIVPVPDSSSTPDLQLSIEQNIFYTIGPEQPQRAYVIYRRASATELSVRVVGDTSGPVRDSLARFVSKSYQSQFVQDTVFWTARVLCRTGLVGKVLCLPLRQAMPQIARTTDTSGPKSLLGFTQDIETQWVLPDDQARPKWVSVRNGDLIDVPTLAGTSTPTYPDQYHTWQLHPVDGTVEEM